VINITNKRARQLYVAEMARLMRRLETTNIRELKPILNRQYMNCARLVQQGVLDGAYHAVDMERDRLATKVALHYRRTATVFGKKAYKIIDSSKGIAFPEEVKAPLDEFWAELNRWIPSQTAMKVTKIQNTSKKLLASVIQKGMQEGESHRQIASRIRSTGRISTLQRAKTIAITETHTAAVHSVDTAIKSTRIEMEKEWSASLDKRTRPDHVVADGQRVPENGVFIVGGMPMKYPGDPAGGPAQTVLCRCVLLYHTVKRMDKLKPYVPEDVVFGEIIPGSPVGSSHDIADHFDKSKFVASPSGTSEQLKSEVEKKLGKKLFVLKSDEMDGFVRFVCEIPESVSRIDELYYRMAVEKLVNQWALTSGDTNSRSVMLQLAAKEEFGLKGTSIWWEKVTIKEAKKLLKVHGKSARQFLRLMYEDTQEYLMSKGLATVRVVRGYRGNIGIPPSTVVNKMTKTKVKLQPMSSFSADFGDTAVEFSLAPLGEEVEASSLLFGEVPANRILSCPVTGFGCKEEFEYVVLGAQRSGGESFLGSMLSGGEDDWYEIFSSSGDVMKEIFKRTKK